MHKVITGHSLSRKKSFQVFLNTFTEVLSVGNFTLSLFSIFLYYEWLPWSGWLTAKVWTKEKKRKNSDLPRLQHNNDINVYKNINDVNTLQSEFDFPGDSSSVRPFRAFRRYSWH